MACAAPSQLNANAVPYIDQRAGPGRPHRRFDPRAVDRTFARSSATKGVTDEELSRTIANRVDALPGQFETSGAVLGAMQTNALYGRPDNYYELLADKYRGADPGRRSTPRCAARSIPTASSGWSSATPPRSGRSSTSSACRSR